MIEKFRKQFNYKHSPWSVKQLINRMYYAFFNRFVTGSTIFLNRNPAYKAWTIGDYTYGSANGSPHIVHYGEPAKLQIGKFCSIADKVEILLGGNHRHDWVTTFPLSVMFAEAANIHGHPKSAGDIIIGNDVWIAQGATILSGITIGNGAVIGVNSVVTKNVPAYAIVAGNPARVIRHRFDEDTVVALEKIAWWNWDIEKILDNADLLLQENIQLFIAKHKAGNA